MRILFQDSSCSVPSLGCVFADCIGYDVDAGTLWFSSGSSCWSFECSQIYADALIREAYHRGFVDLSHLVFDFSE